LTICVGVDDVKADSSANKLTVMGKLDPTGIREKLEQKIKKKVELVSPQPKKDGGGDNKPKEEPKKDDKKKADEKKPEKPKEVHSLNLRLLAESGSTHAFASDEFC
jgi:hypothetical protein